MTVTRLSDGKKNTGARMEIARLERPETTDYREAFRVCEAAWPYLAPLNAERRFSAFRALGIELVIARKGGRPVGACFVLPESYEGCNFVWLFDFAVSPEVRAAGAAIVDRVMRWYPNLMAVGVRKKAGALYESLKWKRFDGVWRCVHPLDAPELITHYGPGQRGAARNAIRLVVALFETCSAPLERGVAHLLANGSLRVSEPANGSIRDARGRAAAGYLPTVSVSTCTGELVAVQRATTGRVLSDSTRGLGRLSAHILTWAWLRAHGATLCEYVTSSPAAALHAPSLGYVPIRMPIYYRDVNGALEPYIRCLPTREFSICSCDKVL